MAKKVAPNVIEENKQLKARLAQLEKILSIMPGHIFWKNREHVYLGCNQEQARSFGLSSVDDWVGKTIYDLVDTKTADQITQTDEKVMSSGQEISHEEVTRFHGTIQTYLVRKLPLFNEQGEVTGLIGIALDISKEKAAEAQLREATQELAATNQLKTDFIHNMQHDIRTPFNGIYGMASYLASQEANAQKKEALDDIVNCAQQLLNYCNEIMDYSRVESGVLPIELKKFNLIELLHNIINMQKPAAQNKALDLQLHIAEDIPHHVISDEYRLQRILINLVSNAIKFTEQGFVNLTVNRINQINPRHQVLQFIVSDTGPGIPKNKQQYIYEKFTRIDNTQTATLQGSGLGLRIVKQFMDELEGDISIEDLPEGGAKFTCDITMKIPLKELNRL